mmetsp:Transcript_25909/g.39804  ORF Transcript_25909/g.39804 Transcript_25909/m.39804 type:complete len:310 (+) Transcript_25909:237-1166(+)
MSKSRFANQKKAGKICLLSFFMLFLVMLESGIVDEYLASFIIAEEGPHYALSGDATAQTIQGETLPGETNGEVEGFQGNLRAAANGIPRETNEDLQILDNDNREKMNSESAQQTDEVDKNMIDSREGDNEVGSSVVDPSIVELSAINSNQVDPEIAGNVDAIQSVQDESGPQPQRVVEDNQTEIKGAETAEDNASKTVISDARLMDGKNNTNHPVDEAGVQQEEKEPIQIEQNEKEKRTKKKKTEAGAKDENKKKESTKSKKKLETTLMVNNVDVAKENGNTPVDQGADKEKSLEKRPEDASQEKDTNR